MRLRFWSNSIDAIYSTDGRPVPEHPVIRQLKQTIDQHRLPKLYFTRLIRSRERTSNQPFITSKELEAYAEESNSSTLYLTARVLGADTTDIDHALSHLGKAQGIVNMLRAQPAQSRAYTVCVPQETLIKHGCSQERVLRDRKDDKAVHECTFEVASLAHSHLEKVHATITRRYFVYCNFFCIYRLEICRTKSRTAQRDCCCHALLLNDTWND